MGSYHMKELQVKTKMKISKPAHEVFEGIVDPDKLSHYFISSGTGRLEEGKTVTWHWADYGDAKASVTGYKIVKDKFISFLWTGTGAQTRVDINLEAAAPSSTMVKIVEDGWDKDDKGIAHLAENTQGWVGFLCSLKAYLEYGINLRKGAL